MNSKKMDIGSKDIISNLPEELICHILSFLPIEESALTSVLSKKWRYLFAFRPNLVFDDRERDAFLTSFVAFVGRVLDLQGNSTINKFSLMCGHGVHPDYVTSWILNVLERGVKDLDLHVTVNRFFIALQDLVTISKKRWMFSDEWSLLFDHGLKFKTVDGESIPQDLEGLFRIKQFPLEDKNQWLKEEETYSLSKDKSFGEFIDLGVS